MVDDKPKPRGKAPCGKDGQPCRWDFLNGCWLEIDGSRHVQRTNADVLKAGRKRVAEAAAAGNQRAKRVRGVVLPNSIAPVRRFQNTKS